MRLLVTRPEEDAANFAGLLRARGHDPVLAPLMEMRLRTGENLTLDGVQAVLATSANGVRALAQRTTQRDIPVFAVGMQTTETARNAGFGPVHNADGDAAALIDFVAARVSPASGTLFHAAGAETAGKLREELEARGFTVRSEILYEMVAPDILPATVVQALRTDTLDGVVLFSPRSAAIFKTLIEAAGLAAHCRRLNAFCISAATASALEGIDFRKIAVAAHPNQDGMLALLS